MTIDQKLCVMRILMTGALRGEKEKKRKKKIPPLNPCIVLLMLYNSLDLLLPAHGADIFSITYLVFWFSSFPFSPGTTVLTEVLIVSGLHTSNSG